jgi:hypothetical protein
LIKRSVAVAKFLVPLIVAFFIGRLIHGNWQQVRGEDWRFEPVWLLASFLLTGWWFLIRPYVWGHILRGFGHSLPYRESFHIIRRAELSRYVPGGVWQYLSRVYLAGQAGIPAGVCLISALVETVILMTAALLPAFLYLSETLPALERYQRALLIAVPAAAFCAIHPKLLNFWAGLLARRFKQPHIRLTIDWKTMAAIWAVYVFTWGVLGLAVALFVRGVLDIPAEWMPRIGAHYAMAWLVGMVSMIAPAGMGIRDGMFGLLLKGLLPIGAAMALAVGVRLWLTLTELIWTFSGRWIFGRARDS